MYFQGERHCARIDRGIEFLDHLVDAGQTCFAKRRSVINVAQDLVDPDVSKSLVFAEGCAFSGR